MTVTIAISGKGGVGKTIIVSVLLRLLNKRYPESNILAIDANLNSDLGRYLGVSVDNTLHDIRTGSYKYEFDLSDNITKQEYIDYCIAGILQKLNENTDVIAGGSPLTLECSCFNAKLIRDRMFSIAKTYDFLVIDCADDIVYLKNLINIDIDSVIILSDSSRSAITSAARIKYSARETLLPEQTVLLLNKIKQRSLPDSISALIDKFDLDIVGIIPFDNDLRDYEYAGKSIYNLQLDSPIVQMVEQTLYRLNLPIS